MKVNIIFQYRMGNPKAVEKEPEKLKHYRESSPDRCDDQTQRSIHWANQAINWHESYRVTFIV